MKREKNGNHAPKMHLGKLLCLILLGCIVFIAAVCGTVRILRGTGSSTESDEPTAASEPVQPQEQKETYEQVSVSLVAVGDNLIHNSLLKDSYVGDGHYDMAPFYSEIKPYIEAADIAVINQESPLGTGTPSAYPTFNTPQDCGLALIDTGFDVISHANNHAMDSGSSAIYDTIEFWDAHADEGVIRIGIAKDAADRAQIRYLERNGMKIGFLAYTFDLNGFSLPEDNPDLVSLIDKEKMAEEIAAVKQECDAVVVMMHWGVEYESVQNSEQEDLAEFLTENGATLIIGSHPHVCQPCEWVESENGNRTFCLYSTGNFISAQFDAESMVEGMLQVTLTRQTDGTVIVENPGVMPLICTFSSWRNFRVIPLDDYTDSMAYAHTLSGMSVSHVRSIAEEAFGEYMIEATIPTTYCAQEDEAAEQDDTNAADDTADASEAA